jgi:hypothetical protein
MLSQRRIVLANQPVGTARVVLSAVDFGHLLGHPLVAKAVQTAVLGFGFAFEPPSARIESPSPAAPGGLLEVAGTWGGDRQRYQLKLQPVGGGAAGGRPGVQVLAAPLGAGGRQGMAAQVAEEMSKFFSTLTLDLDGAQMQFASMRVLPGTGFGGGLAEINLRLAVMRFPPLNVQF